jgi:hypothetical protein
VIPVLLIGVGALFWAWRAGWLRGLRQGDGLAAVVVVIAVESAVKGRTGVAAGLFAGLAAWLLYRRHQARRRAKTLPSMPADAARTLLGVAPDADGEAIRAAHRRLIARVHPDAGGSLALAAQVNAARDTLLAELNQDGRQAS